MGKKQKIRTGTGDIVARPGPLHKQIEKANLATPKYRPSKQSKEVKDIELVDPSLSSKILTVAQKQWEEEEAETETKGDDDDEEISEEKEFEEQQAKDLSELKLQIEEEESGNHQKRVANGSSKKNLFDLIRQKLEQKEKGNTATIVEDDIEFRDLDPTVVSLYTEIGQVLEKYRHGKIPKAFKIIPSLQNWEQIIELTCPEKWTAAVMLQATKMFSTSASPAQCQKFYNLVLLPRVRDDIDEFKKLHFHMYQCLFKAMYKPAAFFKGILLPLCRSNTCTLREAVVFGSMLRKVSIPQMHAAAAILSIAEMDYNCANSYIMRILVEKNFTLPFRVLDGLVFHFLKLRSQQEELPVSWHQCLLSFVEKYAKDISTEQREALLDLIKVRSHHQVTPEIQRILRSTDSRNEESEANIPEYARDEEMDL